MRQSPRLGRIVYSKYRFGTEVGTGFRLWLVELCVTFRIVMPVSITLLNPCQSTFPIWKFPSATLFKLFGKLSNSMKLLKDPMNGP